MNTANRGVDRGWLSTPTWLTGRRSNTRGHLFQKTIRFMGIRRWEQNVGVDSSTPQPLAYDEKYAPAHQVDARIRSFDSEAAQRFEARR